MTETLTSLLDRFRRDWAEWQQAHRDVLDEPEFVRQANEKRQELNQALAERFGIPETE